MTSNKTIRLAKALWQETLKRVPYILLLLLVLSYAQDFSNGRAVRELAQQNVKIAKENGAHIDCVAKLYANGIPVPEDRLNKCVYKELFNRDQPE